MIQVMLRGFLIAITFCSITASVVGQEDSGQATIQDVKLIASYTPRSGKAHFDFILPSIDGEQMIQLSKYRGTKVLLLHFASW